MDEQAVDAVAAEDVDPQEQALRDRIASLYPPCDACGTPLVRRECVYCRALAAERRLVALSIWGDDEWMQKVATLELEPNGPGPRMHALGFYQDWTGISGPYNISSRPQIIFRPELLTIAPECALYGMMVDLKVGNRSQLVDATPLPLSIFSPSSWVSIEMMRKAMDNLALDTVTVAQDVTICVDMTIPNDPLVQTAYAALGQAVPRAFKAILWGRSPEEGVEEVFQPPVGMMAPPWLQAPPAALMGPGAIGQPPAGFAPPGPAELLAMTALRGMPAFSKLVRLIEREARREARRLGH